MTNVPEFFTTVVKFTNAAVDYTRDVYNVYIRPWLYAAS